MLAKPLPDPRDSFSGAIDRAIAGRGHPREWSPALHDAYLADQSGRQFHETRFLLVVGLIVTFATVLIDWVISPDIASHGLSLRLYFVLPVILVGLILGKSERQWPATAAMCLSQIIFALVVVHLSFHMPIASANRYLMSAAIVLGLSNLLFEFRFWQLAAYNAAYVAAQIGIVLLQGQGGFAAYFDYVAILLGISFGTLAISERVSRLQSRNFLLRMRHQSTAEELLQTNQLLQELSDRDPLTGLSNRRHFERLFAEQYGANSRPEAATGSDSEPRNVAIMMIDVDHFKNFNDRYGHQAGDRCLGAVGLVLDHLIGDEGGIVARFGGEEFIAALPIGDPEQAASSAENIRLTIADLPPVEKGDMACKITVSIGITMNCAGTYPELAPMINMADEALYRAKRAGRNRVVMDRRRSNVMQLRA